LVVAHLVCGLVACAEWLHCSRRVSESVGAWERLLQGWWVRVGFPVDTERIAARDYGFPVWLENPAGALLHPVWLCGVVGGVAALLGWLVCCSGWAAFPGGPVETVKSFGEPHSVGWVIAWLGRCDLTSDVVMWAGVVVLSAIPTVTFSTQNCWEPSGDGWWAHIVA